MSKMDKTEYERWREIGDKVKELDRELVKLVNELNDIPNTVWWDQHDRACDAMTQMKSDLEERMAKEHPEEWEISVFYGKEDDYLE